MVPWRFSTSASGTTEAWMADTARSATAKNLKPNIFELTEGNKTSGKETQDLYVFA